MPWTRIEQRQPEFLPTAPGAAADGRVLTYREALREALVQALDADPSVFLLGEGIDDPGGVFGTTSGLKARFGDRVLDTPIAENGMTGVALGAALAGMRPVAIHMRVDFLPMAMDQIVNHVAKWAYMTGGKVRAPLTIRAIVGRGWGSSAQHSQSLQALFAHVPGLRVLMPASPRDAKGMLLSSIFGDHPTVFLEHRWLYDLSQVVPEKHYEVAAGQAAVLRNGTDVSLVAVSHMVVEALAAADLLQSHGVDAEVVDLRSLRPLDRETILASVRRTGRLVVADTGWGTCGISAEVAAVAAEGAFGALRAPVRRVTLPDAPTPAASALEQAYYPGAAEIAAAARGLL
jgi:pyruvate dehydrogenase E1 component beta subunit